MLCSALTIPYRKEAIDRQNLRIQQNLYDLYAKEPDFDKWLDQTDAYLRSLAQKNLDSNLDLYECNLDLYAYAQNIVEYHRYVRRQKEKRQSRKILQSQWQSPFLSTRLRADLTKDRGAILRASDRPKRPADQQAFLELFRGESSQGERLRRLEEASYSELRNHKTWKHVDEEKVKGQVKKFELRATADGYQRAALQAVLRKHIHNEEQYYVGSWENNIVRLPPKPRPRPEAKLEGQKRGYYTWTNKYLQLESYQLDGAEKSSALQELVRPLFRNNQVLNDDIAVVIIGQHILKENIDPDPSSFKPGQLGPASQVWGFPLPDELKPVQPENYFGPEKTVSTGGRKRKPTAAGHGPRSKRPRHDSSSSSEDESGFGTVPLGIGKFMPPEIRDYYLPRGEKNKTMENDKDEKEEILPIDELPFFYLAETNYLAYIKSQHLKDVEEKLEHKRELPEAPARPYPTAKRNLPYWANVTGPHKTLQSQFLPLPTEPKDINEWDLDLVPLTGPASGESPYHP